LKHKRVLVTRPTDQSQPLVNRINQAGGFAIACPALVITPLPETQAIKDRLLNLDYYQHVIAISVNAARIAIDWIDLYWPQLPVGIQYWAVGKSTAQAMNMPGMQAQHSAQGFDSEALLAEPDLQHLDNQRILILRGVGGRELLAETLIKRGASVDYCELYQRDIPEYTDNELDQLIEQQKITDVIVSSQQSLNNLRTLISPDILARCRILLPSARVANTAQDMPNVVNCHGASDEAFLQALTLGKRL
jgi:uroporphyrinogen-III synthase